MKFEVTQPENVVFTLSANFPLAQWKELAEELRTKDSSPAWHFKQAIGEMVDQAEKTFYPPAK